MKLENTFNVVDKKDKTDYRGSRKQFFEENIHVGDIITVVYEFTGGSGRMGGKPLVKVFKEDERIFYGSAKVFANGIENFSLDDVTGQVFL